MQKNMHEKYATASNAGGGFVFFMIFELDKAVIVWDINVNNEGVDSHGQESV